MLAQRLAAHAVESREVRGVGGKRRLVQCRLRLGAQGFGIGLLLLSLGALVLVRLQLGFGGFQCRNDLIQTLGQLLQHIGGRLQPLLLVRKLGHFHGKGLPVEFAEIGVLVEFRQRREAILECVLFGLYLGDEATQLAQIRLQLP